MSRGQAKIRNFNNGCHIIVELITTFQLIVTIDARL